MPLKTKYTLLSLGTLTLIMSLLLLHGCKKKEQPSPLRYTSKMVGAHHWTGKRIFTRHGMPDSFVTVDLDFSILMTNDSLVYTSYDNFPLSYNRKVSNDSELRFEFDLYNFAHPDSFSGTSLEYNFRNNSITFYKSFGIKIARFEGLTVSTSL